MATKRICDRCGAEINPINSVTYVTVTKNKYDGTPNIELCCSCAFHLNEWLKQGGEKMADKLMKAWLVREKGEFIATVVFAETRGKARVLAQSTEACEDIHFCDIEVRRMPQADKYYKNGKTEMYWFDPDDRLALVKECGFICDNDTFQAENCTECSAKAYCDLYTDV